MDWWAGKPEASEGVEVPVPGAVPGAVGGMEEEERGGGGAGDDDDVCLFSGLACGDGDDGVSSGFWAAAVLGLGVSTNMMDGPAVDSSVETAARGVGFEVNFGRDWRRTGGGIVVTGLGREELESCDEELAALWGFDGLSAARRMAVSEALASECGRSGVVECVVSRSSVCDGASLCVPFHMALRRSSWREKNEVLGAVFVRRSDLPWPSCSLSSLDASRSYSSKLLPLMTASLSDAAASSSASSPGMDGWVSLSLSSSKSAGSR